MMDDDSGNSATLGSVIGEFCQDEETVKQLFEGYSEDTYLKNIISKLKEAASNSWKKRYFWSEDKGLFLMDDPNWRLCIPKGPLRIQLLRMYHQSMSTCHPGRERTYSRLRRYFYWPKMAKSVKQFVKACDTCQRTSAKPVASAFCSAATVGRFKHGFYNRTARYRKWKQRDSHVC